MNEITARLMACTVEVGECREWPGPRVAVEKQGADHER